MKKLTARRACAVFLAAGALTLASTAHSYAPIITGSFPLQGINAAQARGVYYPYEDPYGIIYVISHESPGVNYLHKFVSEGSHVCSFLLQGASVVGDADRAPDEYSSSYFSVVDVGTNDVKIYNVEGSLVGTLFPAPPDTVAVGIGGHSYNYIYLGTSEGVIYRYWGKGIFSGSFATGVEIYDLAGSGAYGYEWGDHVLLGPKRPSKLVYAYDYVGRLAGGFRLPGIRNCGAMAYDYCLYWCLREDADGLWAYRVFLGKGMPVEPASLGKVKALFK
jgi:hypothetical protein